MSSEQVNVSDPRILMALTELQELIRGRYPNATFRVAPGEDPEGCISMPRSMLWIPMR